MQTMSVSHPVFTVFRLISVFQIARSRSQLTNTTHVSLGSGEVFEAFCFGCKTLPTKRAVNQFGLHDKVPVSNISEASGGSRRYASIAGGIRLRVDMLKSL